MEKLRLLYLYSDNSFTTFLRNALLRYQVEVRTVPYLHMLNTLKDKVQTYDIVLAEYNPFWWKKKHFKLIQEKLPETPICGLDNYSFSESLLANYSNTPFLQSILDSESLLNKEEQIINYLFNEIDLSDPRNKKEQLRLSNIYQGIKNKEQIKYQHSFPSFSQGLSLFAKLKTEDREAICNIFLAMEQLKKIKTNLHRFFQSRFILKDQLAIPDISRSTFFLFRSLFEKENIDFELKHSLNPNAIPSDQLDFYEELFILLFSSGIAPNLAKLNSRKLNISIRTDSQSVEIDFEQNFRDLAEEERHSFNQLFDDVEETSFHPLQDLNLFTISHLIYAYGGKAHISHQLNKNSLSIKLPTG